ncbi:MAG: cupin domain-containing protein [Actinomycetes bacterium]
MTPRHNAIPRSVAFVLAMAFAVSLVGCSSDSSSSTSTSTTTAAATNGKPQSSVVLDKQAQTVLDQLLQYPTGSQAQVSSAVLTFAPGVSTGLHKHEAPLYVYVLEGTITVTYEGGIVKNYSEGSAILEAVGTAHNGENRTTTPVKLLVVNIGAEGVANTVTL